MNTLLFIMMFSSTLFLDNQEAREYMDKAGKAFSQSKYLQTVEYLDEVIEIEPDAYEAYYLRATSHSYLGNHEKSIADYTFIQDIMYLKRHVIFNNRGLEYAKLNQHQNAIKDFSKAIEIYPNFADAYNNRGHQLEEIGNFQGALIDYHKSIELANSSDLAIYCYNAARLESVIGSEKEAITLLNKALNINPDLSEAKELKSKFDKKFATVID